MSAIFHQPFLNCSKKTAWGQIPPYKLGLIYIACAKFLLCYYSPPGNLAGGSVSPKVLSIAYPTLMLENISLMHHKLSIATLVDAAEMAHLECSLN